MTTYKIGDVIKYRTFGNTIRVVKIIEKCKDVKNHKPGFSGTLVNNEGRQMPVGSFVWGYDYQIIN